MMSLLIAFSLDYSLFLISRFLEESARLEHEPDGVSVVATVLATAGQVRHSPTIMA
jgi:hypothetical protein